mmetsp:Transcript_5746/g.11412  ORF Transcript_5746/g.11412 Transcript_5746/m.11412 type:complete len:87 (-) Transcript_5746:465-725(-)
MLRRDRDINEKSRVDLSSSSFFIPFTCHCMFSSIWRPNRLIALPTGEPALLGRMLCELTQFLLFGVGYGGRGVSSHRWYWNFGLGL